VTVFVADVDFDEDDDDDDEDDDDDDDDEDVPLDRLVLVPDGGVPAEVVGSSAPIAAGGVAIDVLWVLKDSSITSAAAVPRSARTARRMSGLFLVVGDQNSKVS
jgi:hypothetical protein